MDKKRTFLNKVNAAILAAALCLEGTPGWAQLQPPLASPAKLTPAAAELKVQNFPKELGSVTEIFQAPDKRSPHVILVQDAHAVPDAQRAIAKLAEYFEKNAGLAWVGLEGASQKLDPMMLANYPDKEILKEALALYVSKGEISGAVAAAILGNQQTVFEGLEDSRLYEEDVSAYLESLSEKGLFEEKVKKLRETLESLREAWYPGDVVQLERKREEFERGRGDLFDYLHALEKFRASMPPDFSGTHPLLASLLSLTREKNQGTRRQLDLEIKALADALEKNIGSHTEKADFFREKQAYETERKAPEEFLVYLLELNARSGLKAGVSALLRRRVTEYQRVQRAAGEDLNREIASAVRLVKQTELRSELDRRVDAAAQKLVLLEKVLSLELHSEEWVKLKALESKKGEAAAGSAQEEQLEKLELELEQVLAETVEAERPWMRFYEKAVERETGMWEKMNARLQGGHVPVAMLVTGGFHREGFARRFRKAGISYWVVSPSVLALPEDIAYVRHMQGDVSWKKQFQVREGRVDVYEAFHRDIFLKLGKIFEEKNGASFSGIWMRRWRENIFRALAGQNRMHEAPRYTRHLDEWLVSNMETSRRESLSRAWERRVKEFADGVEELKLAKRLNPDSLSGLLSKPAAVGWNAVLVLSHETVPAKWLAAPEAIRNAEKTPAASMAVDQPAVTEEAEDQEPSAFPASFPDAGFHAMRNALFRGPASRMFLAGPAGIVKPFPVRLSFFQTRSELRVTEDASELVSVEEALSKPQLAKLKIAVNLKDVGAYYRNGILSYEDSLRKLKKLLPLLRSQGAGSVYLYGGLYDMGGISSRLHRGRPDARAQYISENSGRTMVKIENYATKKTEYTVAGKAEPLVVEDGHNPFSILSLLGFNPHLSSRGNDWGTEARTQEQLRDVIRSAHELGMKVTLDFIPWIAPDAINESNFRWTFYQELADSENQRFRSLPETGEGETKETFLRKQIDENLSYFTVRIREPGQDERVVLVRHLVSDMGGVNVDQAVLNPFLPAVREYYRQALQRLVDAGADEVRVDLGHVYLREYIADPAKGYFSDAYWRALPSDLKAGLEESLRAINEPWEDILKQGKEYARDHKKELSYVMEAYDENHLRKLKELGADKTYYADVFKNLVRVARGEPAHFLEAALRHAVGNRGSLVAFPSNFDQFPMRAIKGAQNAARALLLVMPELQLDVMWDLRDWIGFSGQVFPMVGGDQDADKESDHTFADQKEFEIITNPSAFYQAVKNNKTALLLSEMLKAIGSREERYIEFLDNARRDRFTTFAWLTEKPSEWRVLALNFKPQESQNVDFIELPREALIAAGAAGFKAVDAETGESIQIDSEFRLNGVAVSAEKQYRLIRLFREDAAVPLILEAETRSELRADELAAENPEGDRVRKLLFEDRVLNDETKAFLISLLPRPLLKQLKIDPDTTPWLNETGQVSSSMQYVFRVSFQDPSIVVFSLAPAMPGPLGLSKEAAVYLPVQDLGDGYLGLLQHGRVQRLEPGTGQSEEEKSYEKNPFGFWLENNLDAAAERIGVKGTLLTPLMLNREQLASMGYRQTKDESLWYRKTGGENAARSELRSAQTRMESSLFGRGRALSEDYQLNGQPMDEKVFSRLVDQISLRIQTLKDTDPDSAGQAASVLEHVKKLIQKKQISVFAEQRWSRTSYVTGAAGADLILMGRGFLALPELSEEAFFRLAENSWRLSYGARIEPGKLSAALYGSEEEFKKAHQDFVELKDERVLRSAIQDFNAFSEGSPLQDTRALFESWVRHDIAAFRKGDETSVYPVLEQAGFLAQALANFEWDKLPSDPEDPDAVLSADPEKAKAFFEILYPLYVFSFYRYQFMSHARTMQNVYRKSIRKTVEEIDQQLRDKILRTPELMRSGKFVQVRVIDYLSEMGYRFPNDVGIPESFIYEIPLPLIESYQKSIGTPEKFREKNSALIEKITWDIYEKTTASGKNELKPAWHLYADLALGGSPSSRQMKSFSEAYHKLLYEILRAPRDWQEEWLEERFGFSKPASDQPKKLLVPGRENVTTEHLRALARSASGYRWRGLLPGQNSVSAAEGDAEIARVNESLSFQHGRVEYLTVSGTPVSPFWQYAKRLHYHVTSRDGEKDRLRVVRDESAFWSELLVWTNAETGRSHYRDDELPFVLPLIGAVRRFYLKKEPSLGPYNFEGVDVGEWVRDIMAIHDLTQMRFWDLAGEVYGSYKDFFDEEKTPDVEQKLFWYYSLFRHPKGLFAELSNRLELIPGTKRLTPEAAAFLLDSLYAIYWTGPARLSLIDGNRWILGRLLHFMNFHPDGVSIPDLEGFRAFLTQDIAEPGAVLDERDFTEWLLGAQGKYGSFSEKGALVETVDMKDPETDGAAAQMRAKIESETDYGFDPENFPAQNILKMEAHPWQNHSAREAVWRGTYRDGLVIPGSAFRYRFAADKVPNGTVLTVKVSLSDTGKSGVFEIWDTRGALDALLVRAPLEEARKESYGRSLEQGQGWEKVPDPVKIKDSIGQNGFEEIQVRENGFLLFEHKDQSVALHLPSFSGKSSDRLFVQRGEQGSSFYTLEGDYLGHVTFGQAGRQALSNSEKIKVLAPIPVPLDAPESASLSDYTNLLALAAELKPLMATGRGYDKLIVTGRKEGEAGTDHRAFVLPGRMLDDVPSAVETIRSLLAASDPSYRLQLLSQELDQAEKTDAYLEKNYVFPDVPALESPGEAWTDVTYHQYQLLDFRVREKRRAMLVLRALDQFRIQHEKELGPHWSKAGLFRKTAALLLTRTDTDFHFHAKGIEFNGLKSLTDMEYQHSETARRRSHKFTPFAGLGVATADHFRIYGGELTLSKNPNPDPRTYLFVRTIEGDKPVVHLFDMNTGEKIEEKERVYRELHAKLQDGRVSLNEALAMASEKSKKIHLNRVSHEIESFMEKLATGDDLADLELRVELTGKLQQLLPSLIKSDYSEINTSVITMILYEILAQGPENAVARADLFQREFSKRADEPTFYLHAMLDLYHESFSLSPENQGEKYEERFYDFFDNAFLPAVLKYTSETGYSQFVHPDSYYQGVVDKLTKAQQELSESIGTYLDAAPPEIRRRDVLALMHGFELASAQGGPRPPWEAYFTRKIFKGISAQEKQISDEEARERATTITAYGGVEGIGASSALIEYRGKGQSETDAIITDAGIKIDNQNTPPLWPEEFSVPPKAVFLTHAHLDHVGAAIDLWEKLGRKVPFYVTPGTADILGKVLEFANNPARDSEGPVKARDPAVVETFMKNIKILKLNRWYAVSPKMKVYFHGPVGHLHGAASLVISTPDSNMFLSGDVSIRAQGPVPAFAPLPPEIAAHIDQALVESTYGMIKRSPEEQQESKLVNAVAERISEGGRVLLPAFANGRAQRVLLLLLQNLEKIRNGAADFKIYIDGQAAVFTALYLKAYPEVFQPYRDLIARHAVLIQSDDYQVRGRMRSEIDERDGGQRTIIISSAGNASQGRSRYWATRLANDPKSGIFFTGYMDPQEMGSQLLYAASEGKDQFYFGADLGFLPLLAKIGEFKLAGHASGDEIIAKVLEPMGESLRQLWIGHGGASQSREVLEWIRQHRPEWNPVILRKLEHAQGSVPMTVPGLAARLEFFNSLNAELLYEDHSAPVQIAAVDDTAEPEALPVLIQEDTLPQTAGKDVSQSLTTAAIPDRKELLQPETVEALAVPSDAVPQEALVSEDAADDQLDLPANEITLTLEKERLTKVSRQELLELRLAQVPDLKASDAVSWLKEEVVRRGLEEKNGTFGESTLRADIKEIRGRSELRDFIDPVLRGLARPENKPGEAVLGSFAAWAGAEQTGSVRQRLEDEAAKNPHYLVLMAGGAGDERNLLWRIQAEAKFAAAHPAAAEDREQFVRSLLAEVERDARQFFETSPDGTLHYSFAFPLEGSQKVQSWFLEYAETIKKIKSSFPGRVTSDLRLLVTREESQDASRREFFQRLARTGAKTLETSSAEGAGMLLKLFVEDGKNKNALVYGAQDLPVEGIDPGRLVRSKVNSESAFPVAVLLTRQLAQVSGYLPADLLGRLTQELPAGMLTFNGTGLEITTLAMELMYRFQADRRIQTAA